MINIKKIIYKIGDLNRERKYKLFCQLFKPDANTKILDVGAAENDFRATSNILEKRYPYPENITVLGVDKYKQFQKKYPKVEIVKYSGDIFPFKDEKFDICWCNAVIEHVGDINKQEFFLKEISRVSKQAFITTPNRYFIFEPHTNLIIVHYLPKRIFDKILIKTDNYYAGNLHLLGFKDIKKLLKECKIIKYEIIRNKIIGFTIDFVIKF